MFIKIQVIGEYDIITLIELREKVSNGSVSNDYIDTYFWVYSLIKEIPDKEN